MPDDEIGATPSPFCLPETSPVRDSERRTASPRRAPTTNPDFVEFDSAARWHFSLSLSLPAICPAIAKPRLRLGPALSRLRAVAYQVLRDVPPVAAPLVGIPGPSSSARNATRRRILASVLEIPLRKNGAFRREMALMFHNDFAALSRSLAVYFPFFSLPRFSSAFGVFRIRVRVQRVRTYARVKLRSGERTDGRPAIFQKSRPRQI